MAHVPWWEDIYVKNVNFMSKSQRYEQILVHENPLRLWNSTTFETNVSKTFLYYFSKSKDGNHLILEDTLASSKKEKKPKMKKLQCLLSLIAHPSSQEFISVSVNEASY